MMPQMQSNKFFANGKNILGRIFASPHKNHLIIISPQAGGGRASPLAGVRDAKKANHRRVIGFVLGAGLEPAQPQWPKDFKSFVSTIPPSEQLLWRE